MTFNKYNFIILAAGKSTRFGKNVNKTTLNFRNKPLISHILGQLDIIGLTDITIVHNKENKKYFQEFKNKCKLVMGGNERSVSVKNALLKNNKKEFTIIHDLARPFLSKKTILNIKKNLDLKYQCVIPYSKATDTMLLNNNTIKRNNIKMLRTPQGFVTSVIKDLHIKNKDKYITDDSELFRRSKNQYKVKYIKELEDNFKLTTREDSNKLKYLEFKNVKFGIGYDIHRIEKTKNLNNLNLGGVTIRSKYKIISHSDGDVILHSITDAILGAISKRDIGVYFPNNKINKNRNSNIFLKYSIDKMKKEKLFIGNIDIMVVSEKPKINIIYNKVIDHLVKLLNISKNQITLKATTNEKSGLIGDEKFIAVWSSVLLKEI
jgi:2-C-methyl-D-erythritol 4-phosphate cytidylyltransferase/2-C-methyl-D-erythritol 2,4-cyclodiphosphate synthase